MTEKEFAKLKRHELLKLMLIQGQELKRQEEQSAKKDGQIQELKQGYEHLKQRLNAKDEKIAHLKSQLAEKDEQNRKLKELLTEKDEENKKIKGRLMEKYEQNKELMSQPAKKGIQKGKASSKNRQFEEVLNREGRKALSNIKHIVKKVQTDFKN